MLLDCLLQHIPDLGVHLVYQLLCIFNILADSLCHKLLHYKRLKQLDSHFLGKSALINLQLRSYNDNGTSGIVHTLAQQVLAETARLTLQHVRQRLQRSVAGSGDRTSPSPVINQRIHSLLKHSFFIAHNDIRRSKLQQSLQPIVSVDNSSV